MKSYNHLKIVVTICMIIFLALPSAYGAEAASQYRALAQDYAGALGKSPGETHLFAINQTSPGTLFKVYVPPGTESVTLTVYTPSEAKIAAVARLGLPPECNYNTSLCYADLPWDSTSGAALSTLRSRDWRAKNTGGRITLVNNNLSSVTTTGEWLYVKALSYGSNAYFAGVVYSVRVNVGTYLNWYGTGNPFPSQPLITGTATGNCSFENGITSTCTTSTTSTGTVTNTSTGTNPFANIGTGTTGTTVDTTTTTDTSGCGVFYGCSDTETSSTTTQTVTPILTVSDVNLMPGVFVDRNIASSETGTRTEVQLKSVMNMTGLEPGVYELYAMLIEGNNAYLAQKDRLGTIFFGRYFLGDYVQSYETVNITSGTYTWTCDIFKDLMDELNFSPAYLQQNEIHFYVAIAPAGSLDARLRGSHFRFIPY